MSTNDQRIQFMGPDSTSRQHWIMGVPISLLLPPRSAHKISPISKVQTLGELWKFYPLSPQIELPSLQVCSPPTQGVSLCMIAKLPL